VVFATLELTAQALVTPARVAAWRALGGGRCLRAACDIQANMAPSARLGGTGHPLHDPCTIAWLIQPSLFTSRPCFAQMDCGPGPSRGRTLIDRWSGHAPNAMVLETLDTDGFFALLGERMATLP
jgi:inosine-uridine nucleoside N-ribohydrolase